MINYTFSRAPDLFLWLYTVVLLQKWGAHYKKQLSRLIRLVQKNTEKTGHNKHDSTTDLKPIKAQKLIS